MKSEGKSGQLVAPTDTEAAEKIEQPESAEMRVDQLSERALKLAHERQEAFGISHLTYEGGQELIHVFGAEKFIGAIKNCFESKGPVTMFEVIKQLEPDRTKRIELYNQMDHLADAAHTEFLDKDRELAQSGDAKSYDQFQEAYGQNEFGPTENNIRGRHFTIEAYRILDNLAGIPGLTEKARGRLEGLLFGRTSSLVEHRRQGSTALDNLQGFNPARFQEELEKNSGSLAKTVYQRDRANDRERAGLFQLQQTLLTELQSAISKITDNIGQRTLAEKQRLVRELTQGTAEFNPHHSNQAVQLDYFIDQMEGKFQNVEASAQAEIGTQTAELQRLIERLKGLQV